MCNFQAIVADVQRHCSLDCEQQLERVALLQGARRISISEPEYDNTGRWWFFISGVVRGTPISVPHIVQPDNWSRIVNLKTLAAAYRRGIVQELRLRGYPVEAGAAAGAKGLQ